MRQAHAEDARTEARRVVRNLLGEERPTAERLIGDVSPVLGAERTERTLELARGAQLTRRSAELAALAALLVGTRELGEQWWSRPRGGSCRRPTRSCAPPSPSSRGPT
ncbi:hypothetical protein [Nonomuraea salmonea]|uniref:hypothetical protein n=1 Tax=Nonomuraea salmonea TaxID=46181 RepID=UPI0031EA303C